jgi:hypothetical protein
LFRRTDKHNLRKQRKKTRGGQLSCGMTSFIAVSADMAQPKADFHNARQASVIVREFSEELVNRKWLNIANSASGLAGANALAGHCYLLWFGD